ncbi:HD domain-containing protein [Erwinia tracheiphila]|uniref:GTP pyrophosphokinase n=1 Tax=Erwinia tracheiphila TaxID=65700 RepID=A0A0M2KHF2_9GAMM|nr:HD domain-containing protein [Erwinia tracheiphila]EOS92763.1 guanosine polyphosphate pyrophosphohydrolase/synthetase [Erwinia tracheiphila PSU-1]KKF36668.1 GTP pyrophosphokinase [Erwinia tracheiphila]UIA88005.1 HD domain-containing protein [Erwinia tracheiphila]UIA96594.1 HD domain-containing protein [Erwinia tracheiphila]
MHSLEDRARRYATKAHAAAGQRRKYTDEPYIVHPAAVVELIRSVGHNEAMLAAAWLHDTIEDTPGTLSDIRTHFDDEVATLVEMLTDNQLPEVTNRAARKVAHFRHSAQISAEAQTIKLADIIDNTRSIIQFDADFASVYLVEKRMQISLLRKGDTTLLQQASGIIERSINQLTQAPYHIPVSWFTRQQQQYALAD